MFCAALCKTTYIEPKLTCTFHLTRSWNKPKDYKNFEENFCLNRSCIQRGGEEKWIRVFLVIYLKWYSAFYIGIRGNLSVVTGATLSNRHICSVGKGTTFSNRHIRSLNRYIHSAGTGATVLNRHVYSPNRHVHSHITFNVGLKSFHSFCPI